MALFSLRATTTGRIPSAMRESPNQWGLVCHNQASPRIGSTSGTKP